MRRLALVALVSLIFSTTPAQATNGSVSMADIRFNPPDVRITPGGTVTWTNNDSRVHDVTADDLSFESSPTCEAATGTGCMAPGDTFAHTFPRAGRFTYHCQLHGSPGKGMTGVVTVG